MLRKYSPEAERRTSTTSPSTSTGCVTDSAVSSKRNFVPRSSGRWLGSDTPPLLTLLVNACSSDSGLRYEMRSRTGWTECGAAGTFIGERQSAWKVEAPTRPAGVGLPVFLDQAWKEVVWSGSAGISSGRQPCVPGRLRAPHRSEGADQPPGQAPGDTGRRLRRAAHRHERPRPLSACLSGQGVGAARVLPRHAQPDGARGEDPHAAL